MSHTSDNADASKYNFARSSRLRGHDSASLITFYDGTGADGNGRTLEQILGWGADRLEMSHDYIQTLFPLPEASGVNDRAPIINKQVFEAFRGSADLRQRLRDAFDKMLWFYGFELTGEQGSLVVKPGSNFRDHSKHWNTRFDHNHLRITRIIRCLRVLRLEGEAQAFYDTMSRTTTPSARSRMYWGRAMSRPLNIAPIIDDEDAEDRYDSIGPRFLYEFEEAKKTSEATASESGTEAAEVEKKNSEAVVPE
ncbi:opioid growth factor receptor conserved region-domain-containing protein [Calycina marina]|uniref:Opioid growth factor receptor conserved region-domain-containing protein n=1 Tax=Calycina marina TaxID=1763456 RepID=A0A9P7YVH3_9HELO|nr:opioid growth factor receptor conserved region-domain-containing protein [Calycina marina]